MRTLEFEIREQKLEKRQSCNFNDIVAGTVGYLQAKFYFYGNEWNDCKKAAGFWLGDHEIAALLDEDNTCVIPAEALVSDRFEVSLTGLKNGLLIKTNKIEVRQEVY